MNRRTAASSGRGARRGFIVAGAACFGCIVASLGSLGSIAACGGRVDGVTGSSGSSGASGTATSTPGQRPPGTGRPPRPPAGPLTNAAVASAIAEDYCKTFSSCCVAAHQPPIDVAKCRAITSAAVEKQLDTAGATESSPADVAVCVAAIHNRTVACGAEDNRWKGEALPIFAPPSIARACQPVVPNVELLPSEPCSASMSCAEAAATCAIDGCTSAGALGGTCEPDGCLDGLTCIAGMCAAISTADVNAACANDVDCRLGLVCFQGRCAPTREHPELATVRSSPYRVGSDTCTAYGYL